MTAPTPTSLTYDKQTYNPGDPGQATLTGIAGTTIQLRNVAAVGTLTDVASGQAAAITGTLAVTSAVEDTTTASLTDADGRTYTLASISQTPAGLVTAVFNFTA